MIQTQSQNEEIRESYRKAGEVWWKVRYKVLSLVVISDKVGIKVRDKVRYKVSDEVWIKVWCNVSFKVWVKVWEVQE